MGEHVVGVQEDDEIPAGRRQSCIARIREAAIALSDHSRAEAGCHARGIIGRSVVHDNQLDRQRLPELLRGDAANRIRQEASLVVAGNHDADRHGWGVGHDIRSFSIPVTPSAAGTPTCELERSVPTVLRHECGM